MSCNNNTTASFETACEKSGPCVQTLDGLAFLGKAPPLSSANEGYITDIFLIPRHFTQPIMLKNVQYIIIIAPATGSSPIYLGQLVS